MEKTDFAEKRRPLVGMIYEERCERHVVLKDKGLFFVVVALFDETIHFIDDPYKQHFRSLNIYGMGRMVVDMGSKIPVRPDFFDNKVAIGQLTEWQLETL